MPPLSPKERAPSPGLLLLAYDAEWEPCRRWVDRLGGWDRAGRLVFFPYQNPELVSLAPELAGQVFQGELLGLDLGTRQVYAGSRLLRPLVSRLPILGWMLPILLLPGIGALFARSWRRKGRSAPAFKSRV